MKKLKGVAIGGGYFSPFHFEAWQRLPEVQLVAFSETSAERAKTIQATFNIPKCYADYRAMLDAEKPDFVDIITPPGSHREICAEASQRGIQIICQKPLAPSYAEADALVLDAEHAGARFMVHDNFRFQPWHREIKRQLDAGAIGDKLHSLCFRSRMGDGWGEEAYRPRQPYFRDYPRFLIYENGVHFIDTFRFLAGEMTRVTAWLRRLNPAIKGEDCALLVFEFAHGALGQWDANRFNESTSSDPRYTFGEFLLEGNGGTLRLDGDGKLTLQKLNGKEQAVNYPHERRGFCGDCVYLTQRHFVDRLLDGLPFETNGRDYLKNLVVEEAIYRSAETRTSCVIAP